MICQLIFIGEDFAAFTAHERFHFDRLRRHSESVMMTTVTAILTELLWLTFVRHESISLLDELIFSSFSSVEKFANYAQIIWLVSDSERKRKSCKTAQQVVPSEDGPINY